MKRARCSGDSTWDNIIMGVLIYIYTYTLLYYVNFILSFHKKTVYHNSIAQGALLIDLAMMECYLEDWIDPEAPVEGNDVDPDQIGKGEGGCDRHLLYSFQEEQHNEEIFFKGY